MGFGFSARTRRCHLGSGGDCLPCRGRLFSLIHLGMSFWRGGVRAVLFLFAGVCFGQGEALRAPRPDVSLGGAPRVGCEYYPPGGEVRVSNFPGHGVDFEVWEDLGEGTFVAWVRLANAQKGVFPWYTFTAEPILRKRAPARVFLSSGAWRGPMVFGGEVQASAVGANGVARLERQDVWPNGVRRSFVDEVDLGGALALPGPARVHPFMGCTMYASDTNCVVDVGQPVTQWVWGRKFWRRRLSAAEIEAVVAADARALIRMGELTEADFEAPATNAAPARLRARGAGVGGLPAPVPLDVRAAGLPGEVGR